MVARSGSVSKNSATRSATAIGPQRSTRYKSFLPRLRIDRPVFSIPQRSPLLGLSIFGGVSSERFADDLADLSQGRAEVRVRGSVFLRPLRDLLRRFSYVGVENKRAAVGQQRDGADLGSRQLEAVLLQLHVAHDVGAERPGVVGERGAAEARDEILR